MLEWLAYGEQEVPKLFAEGDSKVVIQLKGGPDSAKYRGILKIMARLGDAVALRQCWMLKGDRSRHGEHPLGLGCLGCSGGTQE